MQAWPVYLHAAQRLRGSNVQRQHGEGFLILLTLYTRTRFLCKVYLLKAIRKFGL